MQSLHLGRTLLIVAHPDDETGAAGILLQRATEPMVVFCTDGAPVDSWFWGKYGSRETYAELRRREALSALNGIGVKSVSFLTNSRADLFHDQRLHTALPCAIDLISKFVRWYSPDIILTSAYEGGHPDHDSCSFIAFVVGAMSGLPVWEVPLYHRRPDGVLVYQRFADQLGTEIRVQPTSREAAAKRAMLAVYRSQPELDVFAASEVEYVRLQHTYDYSRPPARIINYERWGWPVYAADLCENFRKVMLQYRVPFYATHADHTADVAAAG